MEEVTLNTLLRRSDHTNSKQKSTGTRDVYSTYQSSHPVEIAVDIRSWPNQNSTSDGGALFQGAQSALSRICGSFLRQSLVEVQFVICEEEPPRHIPTHTKAVQWIKEQTGLSIAKLAELLDVTRPTIYSWLDGEDISDANRKRLFIVRDILARAMRNHTTRRDILDWLTTVRTIDGHSPFDLLVEGDFDRARLYAMSTLSSMVKRPPTTINSAVPEEFKGRPEYISEAHPPEDDDDELMALLDD